MLFSTFESTVFGGGDKDGSELSEEGDGDWCRLNDSSLFTQNNSSLAVLISSADQTLIGLDVISTSSFCFFYFNRCGLSFGQSPFSCWW